MTAVRHMRRCPNCTYQLHDASPASVCSECGLSRADALQAVLAIRRRHSRVVSAISIGIGVLAVPSGLWLVMCGWSSFEACVLVAVGCMIAAGAAGVVAPERAWRHGAALVAGAVPWVTFGVWRLVAPSWSLACGGPMVVVTIAAAYGLVSWYGGIVAEHVGRLRLRAMRESRCSGAMIDDKKRV